MKASMPFLGHINTMMKLQWTIVDNVDIAFPQSIVGFYNLICRALLTNIIMNLYIGIDRRRCCELHTRLHWEFFKNFLNNQKLSITSLQHDFWQDKHWFY